jgi:rhomboid family GlyGly-CTERM serine protease
MAPGVGAALEYRRALVAAEPWRLVTGHLVHLGWLHLLVNLAAWSILARLYAPDLGAPQQLLVLVASMLLISFGLAKAFPQIAWYRGLSGALHALYFAGAAAWLGSAAATRNRTAGAGSAERAGCANDRGNPGNAVQQLWLPCALFLGGWIKVATEQRGGDLLRHADWLEADVVTQAHLLGAAFGSLAGAAFAALRLRLRRHGKGAMSGAPGNQPR